MAKALRADQVKANQRILAWLEGRPYREYPEQRRPRVPDLKPEFILRTYTPPNPEWSEQFFTPLQAGRAALEGVALWDEMHVLEPAAGIGHLIYCLASAAGANRLCVTACEIERQAYRIGARLFPWVEWRQGNVFDHVGTLAGRFDLVVCNPPFGGGKHLGPEDRSGRPRSRGWHATQTEYLLLELAARALKPGGQALFIAPHSFADAVPEMLEGYLEDAGLAYTGRSGEPLPGDFLQTGVRVHAFYWHRS